MRNLQVFNWLLYFIIIHPGLWRTSAWFALEGREVEIRMTE